MNWAAPNKSTTVSIIIKLTEVKTTPPLPLDGEL